MELKFIFHGRLTEVFGKSEDQIAVAATSAAALKKELDAKDVRFRESVYQLAQNNRIISGEDPLAATPVDVLPPFSGG